VQIVHHAPAVLRERAIGEGSVLAYASVTTDTVGPIVTNAMTVTSQNQTETFLHATFVEQDTRVITVKPAQRAMLVRIVLSAIQGGNHGQIVAFYFLMY
jgi:hypothetical protein